MGLMYVFPVSKEERDFVVEEDGKLILKSYGLPYLFWFYAFCSIAVVFFMFLAIRPPVLKLIELGDETEATLGYTLLFFIGSLPVSILAFFFYEKRIIRTSRELILQHRLFMLPVFTEKFPVDVIKDLSVDAFLTSPNVARMQNTQESVGFQNKGYFVLTLKTPEGKKIQVDRHSRKVDLEKLKVMLQG